jgi:hypothetical protein
VNVVEPNRFSSLENTPATPTAIIDVIPDPTTGEATTSALSSSHEHQLTSIFAINGAISPNILSCLKLITNNNNQDNLLPTTNLDQFFTDTIDDTTTPLPVNRTLHFPATTDCSSPIQPTIQACTEGYEADEVGSLAVKNDQSVPRDTQIAPEYLPLTLDY